MDQILQENILFINRNVALYIIYGFGSLIYSFNVPHFTYLLLMIKCFTVNFSALTDFG